MNPFLITCFTLLAAGYLVIFESLHKMGEGMCNQQSLHVTVNVLCFRGEYGEWR